MDNIPNIPDDTNVVLPCLRHQILSAVSISKIQQLGRNECGYKTLTWSVGPPNESKCWLAHSNDSYNIIFEKNIF